MTLFFCILDLFHDNFSPPFRSSFALEAGFLLFLILLIIHPVWARSPYVDFTIFTPKLRSLVRYQDVASASLYVNPSSEMSPASGRLFSLSKQAICMRLRKKAPSRCTMTDPGRKPMTNSIVWLPIKYKHQSGMAPSWCLVQRSYRDWACARNNTVATPCTRLRILL
jgi:hypothetical protein